MEGFFVLRVWGGAHIWRGLYMEGIIFGILWYYSRLLTTPAFKGNRKTRVHNRGSQIPLSHLFFFSIPPSRPILCPNPGPVPFFHEIFCLIIEIDVM